MKKIYCLLIVLSLILATSINVYASQDLGSQDVNYSYLKGQKIDNNTAKLLLQKAQAGDTEATAFLFSLDAFNKDKYNTALEQLSNQKDIITPVRYTFSDGSFVEIGTCILGSHLESLGTTQTYNMNRLSYPLTITDEKYVGIGVGTLYFGAYFIECTYYCPDHNHAYYRSCDDRSEYVYPYTVTADGCSCTQNGPNSVVISGKYSYSWTGGGATGLKASLHCFPEFGSNYIQKN